MGVILETTFLVAAERSNMPVADMLKQAIRLAPANSLGVSVISLLELSHGISRADSAQRAEAREMFLDQLMSVVNVYSVTPEIALRAGRLDGILTKQGIRVAFPDLIIGVTALELGHAVLTRNVSHFSMIPGVSVIPH